MMKTIPLYRYGGTEIVPVQTLMKEEHLLISTTSVLDVLHIPTAYFYHYLDSFDQRCLIDTRLVPVETDNSVMFVSQDFMEVEALARFILFAYGHLEACFAKQATYEMLMDLTYIGMYNAFTRDDE